MAAGIPRAEAVAAVLSVAVGVSLLAVKFTAYALTGSAAVFSDAMESIANVLGSVVAFRALALAHRPPDALHPYGYGKAEFLSAGFEGGMILLAGLAIIVRTADTLLFHRVELARLDVGATLVALAMLLNGGVGLLLVRVGRRRGSMTLEADGKHLLSDALTSVAALAALGIVIATGWVWVDPAAAAVSALYIVATGLALVRRASERLMDTQDEADRRVVERVLDAHAGPDGLTPRICSHHKVRHLHSGRYHWVEFHLQVRADLTVEQGHRIASELQRAVIAALGEGRATAHLEPCLRPRCPTCGRAAPAAT